MTTANRIPACFAIASLLAGLGSAVAQPLPAPGSGTPAPKPVGPTAPTTPAPKAGPTAPATPPKAGPTAPTTPTKPTVDREAAAKAYFERGSAYYAAGDYMLARAEFAAGYELSQRPLFLFNMAECSRLNGDLDVARTGYERYLREAPTGSQVALAKERLAGLTKPKAEPPKPAAPAGPVLGPKPPTTAVVGPAAPPQRVLGPMPPQHSTAIGSSSECTTEGGCGSTGRTKRLIGLGVGGGGVLFVFAGVFFWRKSANLGDEVTEMCANGCDWAEASGKYEDSKDAERNSWTMLGVGTAAIAAGGILYWLGMKEEASARLTVVPRADGAAVSWSGRW